MLHNISNFELICGAARQGGYNFRAAVADARCDAGCLGFLFFCHFIEFVVALVIPADEHENTLSRNVEVLMPGFTFNCVIGIINVKKARWTWYLR